jgi:hypothetical protein
MGQKAALGKTTAFAGRTNPFTQQSCCAFKSFCTGTALRQGYVPSKAMCPSSDFIIADHPAQTSETKQYGA